MLEGIDTSDYNTITDFAAVSASDMVKFWYHKATEGTGYSNPRYRAVHDAVRAQKIPFGAYHFFRAGIDGGLQARHFLAAIDGYEGDLIPFLDCEEESRDGVDSGVFLKRVADFLAIVDETLHGKRTAIYFEYSFWRDFLGGSDDFAGHPAFPAAYNKSPALDMTGTGWSAWTLWQHSDGKGEPAIPGITGDVDRDRFNGTDLTPLMRH